MPCEPLCHLFVQSQAGVGWVAQASLNHSVQTKDYLLCAPLKKLMSQRKTQRGGGLPVQG